MDTQKVLGLDPGDTTGYAFAEVSFNKGLWNIEIITAAGEATYPTGIRKLLTQAIRVQQPDFIVIEDYIIRQPHIGQSPIAIKVIGVFQVAYSSTPVQLVLQQPSEKVRMPNSRMLKHGIDVQNSLHIMDAIRHIAIFAQKRSRHESRS